MNVVPFVHEGLGNSSYLLGLGGGEAALIDPDRTVGRYLRAAEEYGWRIAYVVETHLHADFVSGAREAVHATGARVFASADAHCRFEHEPVRAGDRLQLAGVEFEAVATPGHTPEHISYVLHAERRPPALFSGGSLIVGGAARTDLIAPDMTEELTRAQHRTLRHAFESLPDETLLFPTHGGGSFCSAGAGGERASTLGAERASNAALAMEDEEAFVRWFPTTFPATPDYYFRMRPINQRGPRLRHEIPMPPALAPEAFDAQRSGALVIDARPAQAYAREHVPGAISNPFRDSYAVWLGWLVPEDAALLFVTDDVPIERVVEESLLVGYERFAGWLAGGMASWPGRAVGHIELVEPAAARRALLDGALAVDVREPDEYARGHIDGALHIPLGDLQSRVDEVPGDRPVVVYCGHGERASSAASLLERAGLEEVSNLNGGFEAWMEAGR